MSQVVWRHFCWLRWIAGDIVVCSFTRRCYPVIISWRRRQRRSLHLPLCQRSPSRRWLLSVRWSLVRPALWNRCHQALNQSLPLPAPLTLSRRLTARCSSPTSDSRAPSRIYEKYSARKYFCYVLQSSVHWLKMLYDHLPTGGRSPAPGFNRSTATRECWWPTLWSWQRTNRCGDISQRRDAIRLNSSRYNDDNDDDDDGDFIDCPPFDGWWQLTFAS